jgi:hypothetical protein
MSSLSEISNVFSQDAGDCWIYTACNVVQRFIIVTIESFHGDGKYFKITSHGKRVRHFNDFKNIIERYNTIARFKELRNNSFGLGYFRRLLLFFTLYLLY